MDITKIGGLFSGFSAGLANMPFSTELSMILEELAGAGSEISDSVRKIEQIVQAQVLGKAETAKIALKNSTSKYISDAKRIAEIERAKEKLEDCYGDLVNIEILAKHRGEIAYALAACNSLLAISDRAEYWLNQSAIDFKAFTEKDVDDLGDADVLVLNTAGFLGLGTSIGTVIVGNALLMAGGVVSFPVTLFLGSLWVTGVATGLKTFGKVSQIEQAKKNLLEPVYNLLRQILMKASITMCSDVLSFRSQFLYNLRHFSIQEKERSTTHRFGITAKL